MLAGCSGMPSEIRKLPGVYVGTITYREPGREPFILEGQKVRVEIFSDDIPTSSPYKVLLETDGFQVPDVHIEYKEEPVLDFPPVVTGHNIESGGEAVHVLKGETTAELGYPIAFPIIITGTFEDGVLKAEILINASFGRGKYIVFEGKKKKRISFNK